MVKILSFFKSKREVIIIKDIVLKFSMTLVHTSVFIFALYLHLLYDFAYSVSAHIYFTVLPILIMIISLLILLSFTTFSMKILNIVSNKFISTGAVLLGCFVIYAYLSPTIIGSEITISPNTISKKLVNPQLYLFLELFFSISILALYNAMNTNKALLKKIVPTILGFYTITFTTTLVILPQCISHIVDNG